MPLRFLDSPGPTLGMIRDEPSWKLPPGAVYDSLNCLYDQQGMARQRGGSLALSALGSVAAAGTSLGFCYSTDVNVIEELYAVTAPLFAIRLINKTTGATTSLGGTTGTYVVGRPVRHFGFVVFPGADTTTAYYRAQIMAGQTNTTTFTNATATAAVVANNSQITLSGADVTTNIQVGALVRATNNSTISYWGRVVSVDTTKLFTVWPTPTVSFTATATTGVSTALNALTAAIDTQAFGGACAASFQNRLLYGGANQTTVTPVTRNDRRVIYSPLPTERAVFNSVADGQTGAVFLGAVAWPALNYFDVPGADPIIAMEPLSDNELLILTSTHPVIFRGNLTTQLATTSPTVTFDVSEVNEPYGCLGDLSVQRTPKGIVWAGAGGIYAYNGSSITDLTGDRDTKLINNYWRSLTTDAAFVLHGSVYVRGHYIVSGSSGGTTFSLAANLTGSRVKWTRLSGVGSDNFYGLARPNPAFPGQVFAARWWDQSGAAPNMTNGQVIRVESMFAPYTTGAAKTDADGTAVTLSLTTPVIDGGREQTQKVAQRLTVRHQQSSTTAAIAVTGQSKIDAADISAASVRAIGSLSNTSTLTVSNATNANPIVVTTGTHGLQTDDFVDIDGVTGNTNANGRWRIAVINATSFSLVGGIGNGAFGGSPTCKKITETDYTASPLNAGQGFSLKFDGAPNNWEFHGATIAVLEKDPVMSA